MGANVGGNVAADEKAGDNTASVEMADGRRVAFEAVEGLSGPALFALGVRKSGSSIFSNIATALARANTRPSVDIPGTLFHRGYAVDTWQTHAGLGDVLRPGHMYVGFRDAPTALFTHPLFREGQKVLLVRDPRDALVSEYFSNAYSHALPQEAGDRTIEIERARALQTSLTDYVTARAALLDATVAQYGPLLSDPRLLVLRYEDVILQKADWIARLADHYGLSAPQTLVGQILSWADVRPTTEDPTQFVRKVVPGDYREKLSPEAVAAVQGALSPIWERLGYAL